MKVELDMVISRCENLTDWTHNGDSLQAYDNTIGTVFEGVCSLSFDLNAVGQHFEYIPPAAIDLSVCAYLKLWTCASEPLDYRFTLYTDAVNYSYWDGTAPAYNNWGEKTLDLSSPDGTNGTGVDLSNITEFRYTTLTWVSDAHFYLDYIHAYGDVTTAITFIKVVEELYLSSYTDLKIKGSSIDHFSAGNILSIYDDDDVLSWVGRILYPTAVLKGTEIIGNLKALGMESQFENTLRKNFTTLRDSDYILKYIINSALTKYHSYDDEIDNFAITYKYDLKTKIWKMFNYLAMLERAVIHYKPDGEIFFNKYDNLTASGMVWDQDTGHVKITSYSPAANRHITEVPVIGTVNSKGQVYYIGEGTDVEKGRYGINQLQSWKDPEISNYTEAKQLGDNLLAIYSMDTQIIKMLTVGKKHIQVGYTINVAWTGLFTIAAADFLVTKRVWYPMIDLCELMLTDNILTEKAFNIKVINKFYDEDSQEAFEEPDVSESTADGTVLPQSTLAQLRASLTISNGDLTISKATGDTTLTLVNSNDDVLLILDAKDDVDIFFREDGNYRVYMGYNAGDNVFAFKLYQDNDYFKWIVFDNIEAMRLTDDCDLTVVGCVADGTCEIMKNEQAIDIIKDIQKLGTLEIDEYGHEKMDMEKIFEKHPFLIKKQEQFDDDNNSLGFKYYDKIGAKSDLLYTAVIQLEERILELEKKLGVKK